MVKIKVISPNEIKKLREDLNLTQQELAYMLETTPVTVSRWERGESKPSKLFIKEMHRISKRG